MKSIFNIFADDIIILIIIICFKYGKDMLHIVRNLPAPSISAALVTTVVGLLIAIPGVIFFNQMTSKIRDITSDMEGFADELIGRIACEFQGRAA